MMQARGQMDARRCAAAVVRRGRGSGVDVRLVIDVSGSMKSGDPEYLRQDVLNGLGEMLPPGSRAGVWTFGRTADVVVAAWRGRRRVASQRACRAHAHRHDCAAHRSRRCVAKGGVGCRRCVARLPSPHRSRQRRSRRCGRRCCEQRRAASCDHRRTCCRGCVAAGIRIDCLALSAKADMRVPETDRRRDARPCRARRYGGGSEGVPRDGAGRDWRPRGRSRWPLTIRRSHRVRGSIARSVRADGRRPARVSTLPPRPTTSRWFDADSYSIVTIKGAGCGHVAIHTRGRARAGLESDSVLRYDADDTAEAPTVRVELTEAGTPIDEPRLADSVAITAELKTLYGTEPLRGHRASTERRLRFRSTSAARRSRPPIR